MELNFFFTKKWVGGRSTTQGVKSLYRLEPHPLYALKKTGIQGDASPLRR